MAKISCKGSPISNSWPCLAIDFNERYDQRFHLPVYFNMRYMGYQTTYKNEKYQQEFKIEVCN